MAARIYQRYRNAMTASRALKDEWVLEFESQAPRRADPLTGWSGGADTQNQVQIVFPTLDAAKAYATREGVDVHVVAASPVKLKLQSYADNFK
jgi:NADH dehydrogenase ubiquinone Fe-S protein 4